MHRGEVNIITLGCSKNLVDSEQLIRLFASSGYRVRHDPKRITGEIVVVNTCGFIAAAQEESINTILGFVEAKKSGRIAKLIVMGCLSERFRDELESEIPEVDAFYGKFDWHKMLSDLGVATRAILGERTLTTPHHYAYMKISEGCNRHCSYCAIPIITGNMKSRPISELVQEGKTLASKGVTEIQLIAQDLTSYGSDIGKKGALRDLLLSLSDIKGIRRIRLHYAYPTGFPREIIPVIRERENICHYLDIALQHASNKMLRLMRRGITKEETIDLIQYIRSEVPDIVLRTTMMVGHPGEEEKDFDELLDFVESIRFERLGAFAYSHEKDTYAYKYYEDNVPQEIKAARLEQLMNCQEPIGASFSNSLIGKQMEVLIDRTESDYYIGRTVYDSPEVDPEVLIPKEQTKGLLTGHYYMCEITATEGFDLVAHPIIQ